MKVEGGHKRKRLVRNIALACFLTAFILYLPVLAVNQPAFQQWFLNTYRPLAPWQVTWKTLHVRAPLPKLHVENLHFTHPGGHHLSVRKIDCRISLWRLLRGQLALDPLQVEEVRLHVAKEFRTRPKKKKRRLKLRTVLLVQNLRIEDARIKDIRLTFGEGKKFLTEEMHLNLARSLLGGMRLAIDLRQPQFRSNVDQIQGAEQIRFQFRTTFNRWTKNFPYANDVAGEMEVDQIRLGHWGIDGLKAKLHLLNDQIASRQFTLRLGKNAVEGKFNTHLRKRNFALELDTAQPVAIPEIGDALRTFNVAGDLDFHLKLEGKDLRPPRSKGTGTLTLTHHFKNFESVPLAAELAFHWEKGRIALDQAKLASEEKTIAVTGGFQMKPPSLDLHFSADDFPIQRFFEKFSDTNLHPIHGRGRFEGNVQGMGKTIHLQLTGEATEGGYGPLLIEKAQVTLDLTYPQLKLNGTVLTEGQPTGGADLVIAYGPKQPGKVRPKTITLTAGFQGHPLETLLPGLASGRADAELKLSGKPQTLQGQGKIEAEAGEIFGLAFERLTIPFAIEAKKLTIQKLDGQLVSGPLTFEQPLTLHFRPGGFAVAGKPLPGLDLQIKYESLPKKWLVDRIAYQDPLDPSNQMQWTGSVTPENVQLRGKGKIELAWLQLLGRTFREAAGLASFQLASRGPLTDLELDGFVTFEDNRISLRAWPLTTENLTGRVVFQGRRIATENLQGLWGAGAFTLNGFFTHRAWLPQTVDLALQGNQLYFRSPDGHLRLEYDADLRLQGQFPNQRLRGTVTILDGRYNKNFNIIEEIKKTKRPPKEIERALQTGLPLKLDVAVQNLGDLFIDNNVGRIGLAANLHITGTRWRPEVDGTFEVTEGNIHYLGLDFEILRGFMEFRTPNAQPYLEVEAEQEVGDAHITARLHGRTDNLQMDLQGNSASAGPLEKKDVISLILFGMTTSERLQKAPYQQLELGPELVAEQIAHALQRPVARFTHIDTLRLETEPTEEGRVRRLHVGKRLSDRLHIQFSSEIAQEDALQTFLLEYWLTDFFILKGSRRTEEEYQMSLGVRFQSR